MTANLHPGDAPASKMRKSSAAATAPVGVVIPVFNRQQEIVRALEAVAAQTLPPGRLVVVDDGSTDATAAVVEQWCAAPRPFHAELVRQANSGVSLARNAGWDRVRHLDLLTFLDSDDQWPSDFLEEACQALDRNPAAVAAISDRHTIFEGEELRTRDDMAGFCADPLFWLFQNGAGILSCSVVRTRAADRVGRFDPALPTGQDAAFLLPFCLQGNWVHSGSGPVVFYRDHKRARPGAGNLSRAFTDNSARWAKIYDGFYRNVMRNGTVGRDKRMYEQMVRRWRGAGRELRKQHHYAGSARCYLRGIWWRTKARLIASGPG